MPFAASLEVSATEPTSPNFNLLWFDTNTDTLKYYNGSIYVALAAPVGGGGGGITELTGNVTAGPGTGSQVATIPNDIVTYAKIQNVSAASKLLGRGDSGSGDVQEIGLGANLSITGTTINASSGSGVPSDTVVTLDGTDGAGISTDYSRGDHKHGDPNRPVDGEKAALVGTNGTPGAGNKYVTNSDSRNTDARNPIAHASSHENNGSDEINVIGLSGLLADGQTPLAHQTSHNQGGSDSLKLDDLATPDDNTDLNASTSLHGLLQKLPGGTTTFLRADGSFSVPPSSGGNSVDFLILLAGI